MLRVHFLLQGALFSSEQQILREHTSSIIKKVSNENHFEALRNTSRIICIFRLRVNIKRNVFYEVIFSGLCLLHAYE